MSTGKILLGALAGLAAGLALGVLFAPDKGANTRKKIIEQGDDYADGLGEKIGNLANTVNDKIDQLKNEAAKMAEVWKAKAEEAKANSSSTSN